MSLHSSLSGPVSISVYGPHVITNSVLFTCRGVWVWTMNYTSTLIRMFLNACAESQTDQLASRGANLYSRGSFLEGPEAGQPQGCLATWLHGGSVILGAPVSLLGLQEAHHHPWPGFSPGDTLSLSHP